MQPMLHHVSLGAHNIERAAKFYDAALAPLGYVRVWSDLRPGEHGQAVGYGPAGSGDKLAVKQVSDPAPNVPGFHLAFSAPSRAAMSSTRLHSPLEAKTMGNRVRPLN